MVFSLVEGVSPHMTSFKKLQDILNLKSFRNYGQQQNIYTTLYIFQTLFTKTNFISSENKDDVSVCEKIS